MQHNLARKVGGVDVDVGSQDVTGSDRRGLRAQMQESLLTELPRYTRDLESAYRSMWLDKTA